MKTDNLKLNKLLDRLEKQATAIQEIPANEQFIGHLQVALTNSLITVKAAIETLAEDAHRE